MKVDLLQFEAWENLNDAVAAELNMGSDLAVRSYPGLSSAIFELALGTAQFYSHKRSVALIKGGTPHHFGILPYLYKEGYEVQVAPENFKPIEWVESLKKDTCFVIYPEDHAVTGELYETAELEKCLNEKKIFSLQISHHNHLYRSVPLGLYSARICSFDPQTALVFLGPKFKSPPLMVSSMDWEKEKFLQALRHARTQNKENQNLVEEFERNLPKGFSAFLQTSHRCFDRSLIYSEEVAGEALQQFLASALKFKLQKPGWESKLETTHLCRWGGTRNYDEWWKPRPAESILRGLLILGTDVLEHPEVRTFLEKALRECQIVDFS